MQKCKTCNRAKKICKKKASANLQVLQKPTFEVLQKYLSVVCATDVQKRKQKVVQDLQFFCKLSESEAVTVWNEAVTHGLLILYTPWEHDERFKTYSYNGVCVGENEVTDWTDKGMSNTYHNTKTLQSLKYGKYGNDRTDSLKPKYKRV